MTSKNNSHHTTNNKEKFLTLLSELMLKCRNENTDFIENIPVNNSRNQDPYYASLIKEGYVIRFPYHEGNPELKEECKSKIFDMGKSIVLALLTELQDSITLDIKGHNQSSEITSLSMSGYFLSIESIANALAFKVGINTIIMPKEISRNFSKERIVSSLYDIFSLDHDDCILLHRDSKLNCRCCGDEIAPLLNITTFEIGLYSTPDFNSNSLTAMIEPKACRYPNGVGVYSNEIKTPSKKLIIANDLRKILEDSPIDCDDYISGIFGGYHTISTSQLANIYNTDFYIKHHNMMYIQTGDGSSALFQDKNTLKVEVKSEFIYDPSKGGEEKFNAKSNEILVGGVDFTLWALCAMDFDQFVELCKKKASNTSVEDWITDLEAVVINVSDKVTTFSSHYFVTDKQNEMIAEIGNH